MSEPSIQHKPSFTPASDIYDPPETPEPVELLQSLQEAGATFPDPARAVEILQAGLERAGDRLAIENMVRLFRALSDSKNVAALGYLITREQESLREVAARAGCSHVALWKRLRKLLASLGKG